MASGERRRSPHRSRSKQLSFSCAIVFAAVAYRRQRLEAIPPTTAKSTVAVVVLVVLVVVLVVLVVVLSAALPPPHGQRRA